MVTHPLPRDAPRVVAAELALGTGPWLCKQQQQQQQSHIRPLASLYSEKKAQQTTRTAVPLVRAVAAVVGAVTLPADGNTAVVVTAEISERVTGHGLCRRKNTRARQRETCVCTHERYPATSFTSDLSFCVLFHFAVWDYKPRIKKTQINITKILSLGQCMYKFKRNSWF